MLISYLPDDCVAALIGFSTSELESDPWAAEAKQKLNRNKY